MIELKNNPAGNFFLLAGPCVIDVRYGRDSESIMYLFQYFEGFFTGNKNVMLTERGTTFGYQDLVVDYRGIPEMQSFGCMDVRYGRDSESIMYLFQYFEGFFIADTHE